MRLLLLMLFTFICISCSEITAKENKKKKNTPLPIVLLIGDSISIGYTSHVKKAFKGKAQVSRIKGNGRYTAYGIENIEKWLGNKKWDVIHFNWGLWDLCYRNNESKAQGHRDKINGKIQATPEEYKKNLEHLVAKLKATKAKLIWCHTTPVPAGEIGRIEGDAIKYNKIAEAIMKKNNIHINDLHSHALKKLPGIQIKKGDVHYSKKGYSYLAQKVIEEIADQLE